VGHRPIQSRITQRGTQVKILVATIGSRGDVQPYVNLCQGLHAAGHDVTLATNPTLCPLAAAMRQAVSDPQLREKAAELGRQIRAEPEGVTAAVRLIENAL
jgi:UDP:flavonoid glycosyltransferase YjiC (YdhE family)